MESHTSGLSVDEFIEHYGKKGMKWGVRKSRSQVKVSSDFKSTAPFRNKHPAELTNKQLRDTTARIALEKKFVKELPPSKIKSHISNGQAAVTAILGVAATAATIYNLQHNPAVKALMSAGAKKTAQFAASKAAKVPYKQLTLF